MLATFISSTPLLSDSWRLCTRANAAPFRPFLVDRVGASVYVAFSGVQMLAASDPNWRDLVPLHSIGGVPLFSPRRSKESEEPVMVHAAMLNLFLSLFNSFQNQVRFHLFNSHLFQFSHNLDEHELLSVLFTPYLCLS